MPLKDIKKRSEYHKQYMKTVWYPKNKVKHIGYVKRLKKNLSNYIESYKKCRKCKDCGFSGEKYPQVLEFNHLGGKKFEIASFVQHILSLEKLKKEISKCDLVCANCHRIRTVRRKQK